MSNQDCVVLNGTRGTILTAPAVSSTVLSPVRNATKPDVLFYDSSTKEVTYGTAPSGGTTFGTQIAIGTGAGIGQGLSTVAIGQNAASSAQGNYSVAIGLNAGGPNQSVSAVAIGQGAGYTQGQYGTAVGYSAGSTGQAARATSVGYYSGNFNQGADAVSVGSSAGYNTQGAGSVAVGLSSGSLNQGINCVAVGSSAGGGAQGAYSVAIGNKAGEISQAGSSIIINADSVALNAANTGLFVNPMRSLYGQFGCLQYNTTTKEISYLSVPEKYEIQSAENMFTIPGVTNTGTSSIMPWRTTNNSTWITTVAGFISETQTNGANTLVTSLYNTVSTTQSNSYYSVQVLKSGFYHIAANFYFQGGSYLGLQIWFTKNPSSRTYSHWIANQSAAEYRRYGCTTMVPVNLGGRYQFISNDFFLYINANECLHTWIDVQGTSASPLGPNTSPRNADSLNSLIITRIF